MIRSSFVVSAAALACTTVSLSLAGDFAPVPPAGSGGWANQHLGLWDAGAPDHGFEFATITHPGNRPVAKHEYEGTVPDFTGTFTSFGRVDYAYRISTTEVSASQWLPFVRAYQRHWESDGFNEVSGALFSEHLTMQGFSTPVIRAGQDRMAVRAQMSLAMRYCNWLHHGAPTGPDAAREVFETGAYDLDQQYTFDTPPDRNDGARFWIPSWDEWTKAAHYDPNRYGEEQEGYWTYTDGRNTVATPGLPWEGGQTSAGDDMFPQELDIGLIPVAAYADSRSPWGLYDTSGGEREWTDDPWINGGVFSDNWFVRGSDYRTGTFDQMFDDAVEGFYRHTMGGPHGFRIATVVPTPSGASIATLSLAFAARRRRCPATTAPPSSPSPASGGTCTRSSC